MDIVRDLVEAGADIFQRNTNNQLPRHCAKGNYILTKFIKLCEQKPLFPSHTVTDQLQFIRGLQYYRPRSETEPHKQMPYDQVMLGRQYTPFISTLKQLQKSRPFATNINIDIMPKISQPEDHLDICSPRDYESEREQSSLHARSENAEPNVKPEIGPICSLNPVRKSIAPDVRGEDKKVNIFYLRDTLLWQEQVNSDLIFTKLEALAQLKKYSSLQVFRFALEPVLNSNNFS